MTTSYSALPMRYSATARYVGNDMECGAKRAITSNVTRSISTTSTSCEGRLRAGSPLVVELHKLSVNFQVYVTLITLNRKVIPSDARFSFFGGHFLLLAPQRHLRTAKAKSAYLQTFIQLALILYYLLEKNQLTGTVYVYIR